MFVVEDCDNSCSMSNVTMTNVVTPYAAAFPSIYLDGNANTLGMRLDPDGAGITLGKSEDGFVQLTTDRHGFVLVSDESPDPMWIRGHSLGAGGERGLVLNPGGAVEVGDTFRADSRNVTVDAPDVLTLRAGKIVMDAENIVCVRNGFPGGKNDDEDDDDGGIRLDSWDGMRGLSCPDSPEVFFGWSENEGLRKKDGTLQDNEKRSCWQLSGGNFELLSGDGTTGYVFCIDTTTKSLKVYQKDYTKGRLHLVSTFNRRMQD
jgi:hypothetical protein